MDKATLQMNLIKEASRDYFERAGRIFIDDFTKIYGVTKDDVLRTLKESRLDYKLHGDKILIIYFQKG